MKKILSLFASIAISITVSAQTYTTSSTVYNVADAVWDGFSTAGGTYQGISFNGNGSTFAALGTTTTNFDDFDVNNNSIVVQGTRYFGYGGNAYSSSTTPVGSSSTNLTPSRRIVSIPIPTVPTGGKIVLKAFGNISSSTGNGRQLVFVAGDGSKVLGYITYDAYDATKGKVLKIEIDDTYKLNTVILASAIGDSRVFRMEVITYTPDSSLSTISSKKTDTKIYTSGKTLTIKDLKSKNTEIKVYNMNGTLVKSVKTSTDIQFELNNGLYIIHTKSELGEKSVKVSIK